MFHYNAYEGWDVAATCLELGDVNKQVNASDKFSYQVL